MKPRINATIAPRAKAVQILRIVEKPSARSTKG